MKFCNWKHYLMAGAFAFCAQSGTVDALLAGVKTTGMAATSTSYPIDCFAGAYNPAGMALLCDRFDVEANWSHYSQRAIISNYTHPLLGPQNSDKNGARTPNAYGGNFGINKSFCLDFCNQNVQLSTSLIVYNRNFIKTTYSTPYPLFGSTPSGLEYIQETIAPIIAVRFCDRHSLGIAFNYHIQRLKVNGLENFSTGGLLQAFSSNPAHTSNRGYNYAGGFGVTLGYLCEITDCLRVGVAWQPKQRMSRFKKYDGFVADKGRLDVPSRFQAGISYTFRNCLTAAFDFEHVEWRGIPQLKNPPFPNFFTSLLGEKNGAGFGFDNQNFWRFGLEYKWNPCFTLRAGFRHANTPVLGKYTATNILTLDMVENVLTCGATWTYNCMNEFSFFYAYGFEKKVTGVGAIPATSPFFGQADSTIALKQSLFVLGLSWGRHF